MYAQFPPGHMSDQDFELRYWRMRLRWALTKRCLTIRLGLCGACQAGRPQDCSGWCARYLTS